MLDRNLAERITREEQDDAPVSDADAVEAIPAYDESQLPDPFGAIPPGLDRL